MKQPKITPAMHDALERVARGLSLRGYAHASTYWALRRKGLIFDSETITDAGRAAIGLPPDEQMNEYPAGYMQQRGAA